MYTHSVHLAAENHFGITLPLTQDTVLKRHLAFRTLSLRNKRPSLIMYISRSTISRLIPYQRTHDDFRPVLNSCPSHQVEGGNASAARTL
jgi:hypothetical protein